MSMTMMEVEQAFTAVQDHESIKRDSHERIDLQPGDAYPQGDVIFVPLHGQPKRHADYQGRQLAPGDTQGSRHVAEGADIELYIPDAADVIAMIARTLPRSEVQPELLGPTILSSGFTVTHPEHGDRTFTAIPAGCHQVVYQRAYAEEIRRQVD